ncbi:MAG: 2-amino-4-hydroxy-6-hydroxymethyldihydropteridine diphosphokinase [Chitinophagaceae bacterium]|nr:MAG: 2-amino-4-hydroxy-6-hydroxymethyldihydropteridine diphosphokinase [Chitinophagaceae bacterium]
MKTVYLLLGTNLGYRIQNLSDATILIEKEIGCIINKSSIYETEPWGVADQDNYLNQVLVIQSDLCATAILEKVLSIEKKLGRERTTKYAARTIDIDILFYNNEIVLEDHLKIPHPFIHKRRFVLEPLNEISPQFKHPLLQKTIGELLAECDDTGVVTKINRDI